MRTMMGSAGVVMVVLAVALLAAGCGEKADKKAGGAGPGTPVIAQKNCPVMSGPIDKSLYVDYQGRRIYFCCNDCVAAFKKEPEKYIKKVDEELKALAPKTGG